MYPVSDGMEVLTHTPRVQEARKVNLELILSNHNSRCQTCTRSWMDCELQALANKLSVETVRFEGEKKASASGYWAIHCPGPEQMYTLQEMCQRLQKCTDCRGH